MSRPVKNLNTSRVSREQETRSSAPLHENYDVSLDDDYEDDGLLSTRRIPAREGYHQRWVRTTIHGVEDSSNVQRMYNNGYRPRLMSTVPQGEYVMHLSFNGDEVIGIMGSVLFEIPLKLKERLSRRVERDTHLLMASVNETLDQVYEPKVRGFERPKFTEHTSEFEYGKSALIDN